MTNRYFVFGAGFSGRRIARDAARRGVILGGTTRSADKAADLEAEGIPALIFSGALEQSNVDLTNEFTQMITTQRGFQASSRTVSTANTLLGELVNLGR